MDMHAQPSPPDQSQELADLAERLNESLRLSGASSAEQTLGLGCSLGLTPILVILLVLFILKVINLILALILLVMALLALVGVAMLAAQRARLNGVIRAYRTSVEAEINLYLAQSGLTRPEFDRLVSKLLPEGAPLQAFLSDKEQA
jgi:uncharacterized protein (DUF58 family)